MDAAKGIACEVAAEQLRKFGPLAERVELSLYGVTPEAFDLAPGSVEIKPGFQQKRYGSSGVEFKIVLFDIDNPNAEINGRYMQWLDKDDGPLMAREWWPKEAGGVMREQDLGQLIAYSRTHAGSMWGPPQVLQEAITLAAARTNSLTRHPVERVITD